jgi:hypothetical protein
MHIDMQITKRRIQNHFHYSFWKYILLVVLAVFGWNLIYTTTRYRPPESAKIELFAEGAMAENDALDALVSRIHRDAMPELEEVTATTITFDDAYGDMQLTVWVSAGQGDVYLISKARYLNLAANEGTLDLTPYLQSGALAADGIDLAPTTLTRADGPKVVGIPADSLTGLAAYGLPSEGMVLCVLVNGGNDAYAVKFLNALLADVRQPQ